jgi:hypothetical protein
MYSSHPELAVHATSSSKTELIVLSMDCRILHVTEGAGDLARLFNQGLGRMLSQAPGTPLPHPGHA